MSTLAIEIDQFSSKLWKHLIGKFEIENSYSHCRLSNGTIASEIITDVQTQGKYDSDTNDDVTHSMHTCTTYTPHSLSHTRQWSNHTELTELIVYQFVLWLDNNFANYYFVEQNNNIWIWIYIQGIWSGVIQLISNGQKHIMNMTAHILISTYYIIYKWF